MRHENGSRWHNCSRWTRRGLACPFTEVDEPDVEEGDPPDEAPPVGVPGRIRPPPTMLLAGKRVSVGDVLAQAEEIVAGAAEAIPVAVEGKVASLAERLVGPSAGAVTGVAAGAAIRAVVKGIRQGGFGGGFNFPSVFDPQRAFRLP